jgi:hypothetical protein
MDGGLKGAVSRPSDHQQSLLASTVLGDMRAGNAVSTLSAHMGGENNTLSSTPARKIRENFRYAQTSSSAIKKPAGSSC